MHTDILSILTKQSKQFLAPVLQLNQLAVSKAEKLATLQLANLQYSTELGFAQWKAAVAVHDSQSLQAYRVKQGKLLKAVGKKLLADAQQIAQLGAQSSAEARQIVQEGVAAVLPKAA